MMQSNERCSIILKDIMEEKRIKNSDNRAWFILKIIFALAVLFTGTGYWIYAFWIMNWSALSFAAESNIVFIIPMSESYIKKRTIVKMLMTAISCTLLLAAGTCISVYLFHKEIYGREIFSILIHLCASLTITDVCLAAGSKKIPNNQKSTVCKIKAVVGTVVLVCAEIAIAALSIKIFDCGRIFSFAEYMNFVVSDAYIIVMLVIMALLLADIIYECIRFDIGEYRDISVNTEI